MSYTFRAVSPSDPSGKGLGYHAREAAEHQASVMNKLVEEFDTNPLWNKAFWKTKPEPWIVVQVSQ